MEKTLISQEMENEILLTGYGFNSSMKIEPNLDFDKGKVEKIVK